MNSIKYIQLLSIGAVFLQGREAVKISKAISGFQGVTAKGPFDITVSMGPKESVQLEGDATAVNAVNITVDRYRSLQIRSLVESRDTPKNLIKISITAVELDHFNLDGFAKVNVPTFVQCGSFRILATGNASITSLPVGATTVIVVIRGSSRVTADLHATVFQAVLSGNATFTAKGAADVVTVDVSGSSHFHGEKLHGGFVTGSVRGRSEVELYSKNEMKVAVYDQGVAKTSGLGELTKDVYNRGKIN